MCRSTVAKEMPMCLAISGYVRPSRRDSRKAVFTGNGNADNALSIWQMASSSSECSSGDSACASGILLSVSTYARSRSWRCHSLIKIRFANVVKKARGSRMFERPHLLSTAERPRMLCPPPRWSRRLFELGGPAATHSAGEKYRPLLHGTESMSWRVRI